MKPGLIAGAISGAVGTIALDVASYGDMLLRGRPPSELPAQAAAQTARSFGVDLDPERSTADRHRASALGAILGYATGVSVGATYGLMARRQSGLGVEALAVGGAAMVVANAPMVAQGLTDPRTWGVAGWVSDIVPHVAYGLAAAITYRLITDFR